MKKVALTLVAVLAMARSANLFAQDQQQPDARGDRGAGWMEKMKAARVAFLTTELDLSAEEAQSFWPVYNQAQEEKDAAYKETRTAYRALTEAIKDGKPDKEIATLLQAYLKASKVPAQLDAEYAGEFLKVLPATKVAKLYTPARRSSTRRTSSAISSPASETSKAPSRPITTTTRPWPPTTRS